MNQHVDHAAVAIRTLGAFDSDREIAETIAIGQSAQVHATLAVAQAMDRVSTSLAEVIQMVREDMER